MSEEFKLHIVEGEEKLSAIAQKHNISIEELKKANPEMRTFFSGFFGGAEYASAMQKIRIPIIKKVVLKTSKPIDPSFSFEPLARYRCEQFNVTRINEETITLSSETKSQYLYCLSKEQPMAIKIILEDSNFSVEPVYFKEGFEFGEKIEKIKDKVIVRQNRKGEVSEILNKYELEEKWKIFRDKKLLEDPLYKSLKEKSPKQAQDIIDTGNKEFSSQQNLGVTLGKNLFFHILLRANIGEELQDYDIKQYSQLFPNLELTTHVVKSKVKEENGITTYRLVGTLNRNNLSEEDLKQRYDELYKPMIKYNYTEFNYIYRITYSINADNLLLEAKASLCEKIKNNFEAVTEYTIRKVEL
ncbi:LysM domain-containing protein [Apibacter muscae]|uniref:LysM peptidoglycan-binding domain-containing protein n=1 Tax=Apibacter muscae TaxID=2509004 RepID=UPI0011ABED1A|nr:LysM domain-containing protein [Apibacter muscae]TWP25265.1 LysM domain-containing protein [Apibacter muscae]